MIGTILLIVGAVIGMFLFASLVLIGAFLLGIRSLFREGTRQFREWS